MTEATLWWILAGVAVGIEMLTATFYLLMLSSGLVAAALAAQAGASVTIQILTAALVGGAATVGWRAYKKSQPVPAATANHDVNLDIGETVHVDRWEDDATAGVKYRGAHWTVALAPDEAQPEPGTFHIVEVIGSRLIVKKS